MSWLRVVGRRLRAIARLSSDDREMTDEMRFHIEMEAKDLMTRGMPPDEAHRTALANFGGIVRYREEGREARGASWLADLTQDVRYARRTLGRNRGYAFVSILTLALAIGASATIFGVTNGVLLKPLPFEKPEKLYQIWDEMTWMGVPEAWITGPEVVALRANLRSFEALAVIRGGSVGLSTEGGEPEQINFSPISANFFQVLGRGPEIGRAFLPEEDVPNGPRVGIISHALFQRRFAGDSGVLRRTKVLVDGQPTTIVGVLPPDFRYSLQGSLSTPLNVDLYTPIQVSYADFPRGNHTFGVIGRVKNGVSNAAALGELARFSKQVDSTNYGRQGFRFAPISVRDRLVREVRPAIIVLMLAVGLLVVTMCANLATLSLARASRREREFAVRRALGAGLGRVARQVFTETMLISVVGAAFGVLLAIWGLRGLLALAPSGMPRREDIGIDPIVVGFTLALGVAVGIAMGLAPLMHSWRVDISGVIGEKATTGRGSRFRGTLVVAQVALSLMLLAGTALLLTSFAKLTNVNGGFRADGAVLLSYVLPVGKYQGSQRTHYHQRVVDRMRQLPGVTSVGLTSAPPLSANLNNNVVDFPNSPTNTGNRDRDAILIDFMTAGPDYFKSMGIPMIEGRDFVATDDSAHGGRVAIIDEQLAKRYFPRGSAVGQLLRMDTDTADLRVVGVVGTVYQYGLREAGRPQVYAPSAVVPYRGVTIVIRTTADEAATMRAARSAFHEVDPAQPIEQLTTMRAVVNQSLGDARLVLVIIATFAFTALLLAAIGIYGVTSTAVTARSREMGIRVALGAQPREVLALMIRQPMGLIIGGTAVGIAGTIASRELLAKLLFGVSATDASTLVAVVGTLLTVAFVSVYAPASRATRVDAARVLRSD
jgi:putative ABC transport system permease protein